jgi:hypothetical protein
MPVMCLFSVNVFGQIAGAVGKKIDQLDTLTTQSYSVDLDFQFHLSHKQTNANRDFRFLHASRANYLFQRSDIELDFSQILEHSKDGQLYYNHYAIISSGLYKYRVVDAQKVVVRPLYPEPMFISQNSSRQEINITKYKNISYLCLKF